MSYDLRRVSYSLASWIQTAVGFETKAMEAPETVLGETFTGALPYNLLEPMNGAVFGESWGGRFDEVEQPFQLISYGIDGNQSLELAVQSHDKIVDNQAAMVLLDVDFGTPLAVDVLKRSPEGGPDMPEKVAVDVWETRQRFILHLSLR